MLDHIGTVKVTLWGACVEDFLRFGQTTEKSDPHGFVRRMAHRRASINKRSSLVIEQEAMMGSFALNLSAMSFDELITDANQQQSKARVRQVVHQLIDAASSGKKRLLVSIGD